MRIGKVCMAVLLLPVFSVFTPAADSPVVLYQDGIIFPVPVWEQTPFEVVREPIDQLLILSGQVEGTKVMILTGVNADERITAEYMDNPAVSVENIQAEHLASEFRHVIMPRLSRKLDNGYFEVSRVVTAGGRHAFDMACGVFQIGDTNAMFIAELDGPCTETVVEVIAAWINQASHMVHFSRDLATHPAEPRWIQPATSLSVLTLVPPQWNDAEFTLVRQDERSVEYELNDGRDTIRAKVAVADYPPISEYSLRLELSRLASPQEHTTRDGYEYTVAVNPLFQSAGLKAVGSINRIEETGYFLGCMRTGKGLFTLTLEGAAEQSLRMWHHGIAWIGKMAMANDASALDKVTYDIFPYDHDTAGGIQ